MLRTFVVLSALVALPAVALADASSPEIKGTNSQGNCNAVFSSQITHNGQAVREQAQRDDGQPGRGELARMQTQQENCTAIQAK